MLNKSFVLKEDFNFFGEIIPKGTVYKPLNSTKDYYIPTIIRDKIPHDCPNMGLHYMHFTESYFIEVCI